MEKKEVGEWKKKYRERNREYKELCERKKREEKERMKNR